VRARAADLSVEVIEAGFWARRETGPGAGSLPPSGSGFGSGEVLDTLAPGPSLAGMTDAVTGGEEPGRLDDDELIGVLRAWRRLESWSAAGTLSAIAELARRRPAERTAPAPPGAFPEQMSEFLTEEIGAALTLTAQAASACLELALDLAIRLPETAAHRRRGSPRRVARRPGIPFWRNRRPAGRCLESPRPAGRCLESPRPAARRPGTPRPADR
jgi:hypothetical protein